SGVMAPVQICASAGSRRGEGEVPDWAPEDIAAAIVTAGWRASSRSSSCPVYPVAPAMATRAAAPRPPLATRSLDCTAICIGKNIYTRYYRFNQQKSMNTRDERRMNRVSSGLPADPMKARRQAVILEVVDHEALHSQEELRR